MPRRKARSAAAANIETADLFPLKNDDSESPAAEASVLDGQTSFELHLGDCVAGMNAMAEDSVDVVVTSPPYNLGIDYGTYRDKRSSADYLVWTRDWAAAVRRVLRPDGSFFLNIGSAPAQPFLPHQVILELADLFELQNTLHWIKSISIETIDGDTVSAGHFKPINSKRFVNDCHEYVFHLTHDGKVPVDRRGVGVPYVHKSNIGRWKHTGGDDKRCRGNTWFVPYKTIMSRDKDRPHPATFPVQLANYCLRLHGKDPAHTTLLDPFMGIGHSAEAARELGVKRCVGFDIDETYLSTACERLGAEMIRDQG
jgi:site-specific DNA-methyltransferase (adenine-specific)